MMATLAAPVWRAPMYCGATATLEEAYAEVRDALAAVVELYADQGRALPEGITLPLVG